MSKSKDQAARIADYAFFNASQTTLHRTITRRIRRAITAAVRKERERCVGIVQQSRGTGEMGKYERAYMCDAIAESIRKGKA